MSGLRTGLLHGGLPYLALGQGPPLVVFTGLSATNANPTGLSRTFAAQSVKPLARRFTVYAVNRRPGLAPGTTIRDMAGQYAAAIGHEFAEPVPVQGVSTGGSIAQQFAIDHPQLVRRLVLVAAACRLSPYGREVQRRLAELTLAGHRRRAWAGVGPALTTTALGGRLMAALLWLTSAAPRPPDASDLVLTIKADDEFDACPDLHRIGAPTLLIAGERDRFYSPELFRETAAGIPNARLCLYPGKGHAATAAYRPAIREILGFLAADGARPPG